eukprot:TRINITY_DN4892_c0_g1_i1.p1 TRINITY_DN4892_c0_g1~~TRINITY_DN4892_c0_g1_i1.p1  ORF type:complete len:617 (+),score=121.98 TRINITY_DN4892_c0_g1_i1:545-2395(+)
MFRARGIQFCATSPFLLSSSFVRQQSSRFSATYIFPYQPKWSNYRSFAKKVQGPQSKPIFAISELQKILPNERVILNDVSVQILDGAKIGVVGVNGSGKSTLMKIIAGLDSDFDGTAETVGNISVGYLAQEPELDPDLTVKENIMEGVGDQKEMLDEWEELNEEINSLPKDTPPSSPKRLALLEKQYKMQKIVDKYNLTDLGRKIDRAIDALRCPPGDYEVASLSGGERRRVALARLLISSPDLLLLDEPTNHLDAESVAWLERFLSEYKGAVIFITHDRYFLDNVAKWILEVDRGSIFPFKGNYTAWLESKQQRLEAEKKKEASIKKQIGNELAFLRQGRSKKSNKDRVARYQDLLEQKNAIRQIEPGTIVFPPGPKLGNLVIEVKNLSKTFGEKVLFDNLSFKLEPGAIVGVVGANGSGKTSLFNIMAGYEKPDAGTISIGTTVKMGYVSQHRSDLDPEKTIYEEISDGYETVSLGANGKMSTRVYVANFNFKSTQQEKLVGSLSGGERNRVHLAKTCMQGCNLLLLDEPTNDLDVEVLRNMENALQDFTGCAVIISHDRYFLDRICTHIIAFEGDSNVVYFDGNYSEYEEERFKRTGRKFDPKRIKYRKLETV